MADGSGRPRYENMKTRRVRIESKLAEERTVNKASHKRDFVKVSCLSYYE